MLTLSTIGRVQILEWCREHCPDLRIGYTVDNEGLRTAHALFSINGEQQEISITDKDADTAIARAVYRAIARAIGIQEEGSHTRDLNEREQEIIEAALSSDKDEAKRLARAYAEDNAGIQRKPALKAGRGGWQI